MNQGEENSEEVTNSNLNIIIIYYSNNPLI